MMVKNVLRRHVWALTERERRIFCRQWLMEGRNAEGKNSGQKSLIVDKCRRTRIGGCILVLCALVSKWTDFLLVNKRCLRGYWSLRYSLLRSDSLHDRGMRGALRRGEGLYTALSENLIATNWWSTGFLWKYTSSVVYANDYIIIN